MVLATIASSTAVFTTTPFLLRPLATEFGATVGAVGWISTAQLAGFVLASWFAGRHLQPVRSVFIALGLLGFVSNLASAVAPSLAVLTITRFGSGLSLGLAAWFAWQAAFGHADKTRDVAVVGPLIGVMLPPLVTSFVAGIGYEWLFVILAVGSLSPLVLVQRVPTFIEASARTGRNAATRGAKAMLVALTLVTMGGSSVFVYAAAIGTDNNDWSPFAVSLFFSSNALVSIPAAKWRGRRGPAGMWFTLISLLAFAMPGVHVPLVYAAVVIAWGFCFFMGIPAAFALLASRSRFPEERAGDAQAVMALGRVFGPLIGGIFIAAGQTTRMGLTAAALMFSAGVLMLYVDRARFESAPLVSDTG